MEQVNHFQMKTSQALTRSGKVTAKGVHTFIVCDGSSKKAQKLSLSIEEKKRAKDASPVEKV